MSSTYNQKTCGLDARKVCELLGTLLDPYLGTLTYADGTVRKAVTVNKLNKTGKIEGLELVVSPAASHDDRYSVWVVYLIARDDKSALSLGGIAERFNRAFPRGTKVVYLPANFELSTFEQLVINIPIGFLYQLQHELGL